MHSLIRLLICDGKRVVFTCSALINHAVESTHSFGDLLLYNTSSHEPGHFASRNKKSAWATRPNSFDFRFHGCGVGMRRHCLLESPTNTGLSLCKQLAIRLLPPSEVAEQQLVACLLLRSLRLNRLNVESCKHSHIERFYISARHW